MQYPCRCAARLRCPAHALLLPPGAARAVQMMQGCQQGTHHTHLYLCCCRPRPGPGLPTHGGGLPGMHWDPIGPPGTPVSPMPLQGLFENPCIHVWCTRCRSPLEAVPGSQPMQELLCCLRSSCCMRKQEISCVVVFCTMHCHDLAAPLCRASCQMTCSALPLQGRCIRTLLLVGSLALTGTACTGESSSVCLGLRLCTSHSDFLWPPPTALPRLSTPLWTDTMEYGPGMTKFQMTTQPHLPCLRSPISTPISTLEKPLCSPLSLSWLVSSDLLCLVNYLPCYAACIYARMHSSEDSKCHGGSGLCHMLGHLYILSWPALTHASVQTGITWAV